MKKINWNKIKSTIKNYRLGNYLREFSIVTGGVLVTFLGSAWISENARQKEVSETMLLIAKELRDNQKSLQSIKRLTDDEVHISSLLAENKMEITAIPKDTLFRYDHFFSNLAVFRYRKDALEVLKNSSLMQYIPDKQMLQEILQTYYQLEEARDDVNAYYSIKKDILYKIILSQSREDLLEDKETDYYDNIASLMETPLFLSFVVIVPNFIQWKELTVLDQQLTKQINTLEKRYSFQLE